ncbi:MAG: response regulator transcription factor, partial [Pseudomonadota bacterium]
MIRIVLLYAAALAIGAMALTWLEYQYVTRVFAGPAYIVIVAVGFAALGVWIGRRLTGPSPSADFEKNEAALKSLGVSPREYETLALLAAGLSNKEIARKLGVSPNTVKTHCARLYEKLGAARRTDAVNRARELSLIP